MTDINKELASQFLHAMNLANKSMDLSIYLGEKVSILEEYIQFVHKVIDKLDKEYLSEVGYYEKAADIGALTIDNKKYKEIRERLDLLSALEAAGVDNWEGYADAMEMLYD